MSVGKISDHKYVKEELQHSHLLFVTRAKSLAKQPYAPKVAMNTSRDGNQCLPKGENCPYYIETRNYV